MEQWAWAPGSRRAEGWMRREVGQHARALLGWVLHWAQAWGKLGVCRGGNTEREPVPLPFRRSRWDLPLWTEGRSGGGSGARGHPEHASQKQVNCSGFSLKAVLTFELMSTWQEVSAGEG